MKPSAGPVKNPLAPCSHAVQNRTSVAAANRTSATQPVLLLLLLQTIIQFLKLGLRGRYERRGHTKPKHPLDSALHEGGRAGGVFLFWANNVRTQEKNRYHTPHKPHNNEEKKKKNHLCNSPTHRLWVATNYRLRFFFFFFSHTSTFRLLDNKPWSQEVSSLLPPGSCLQFLSRIGFSNPTTRRFFIK